MISIVTGASENHSQSVLQLLKSIKIYAPHHRTIVYDFGGLDKVNLPKWVIKRKYDYSRHPDWHDITKRAGEYAWKPQVIWEVLNEFKDTTLWLDAGDLLHSALESQVSRIINSHGFYSPKSSGTVSEWTSAETLFRLRCDSKFIRERANRNGAIIGFKWSHDIARNLAYQWMLQSSKKEIIAPISSSRKNHRQDQSVLSVLSAKFEERQMLTVIDDIFDITIHNDCD